MWAGGKAPANAGSSCAQPGAAVNAHVYGSWCFCANTTTAPVAPLAVGTTKEGVVPNLDGKTFVMVDAATNQYVSWSTYAPPGMTGGEEWLRADYAYADATPFEFHAVAGKPDTYTMKNVWPGDPSLDNWVSFTYSGDLWIKSDYGASDALPVTLLPQEQLCKNRALRGQAWQRGRIEQQDTSHAVPPTPV